MKSSFEYMLISSSAFVPSLPLSSTTSRRPCDAHTSTTSLTSPVKQLPRTITTKRRSSRTPQMTILFQHTYTVLEVVNTLVVSCGIGLAGIVGGKATEQVRQLTHSDARMQAMERLSGEIDSVRRRRELATNIDKKEDGLGSPREWSDVAVDKLANIVVVEDEVPPTLGPVSDELTRFDSLLIDRYKQQNHHVSKPLPSQPPHSGNHSSETVTGVIKPSDFLLDDDDDGQ